MSPRSACLLLDTKHPKENTKLLSSVGHTPGENPKIHIFTIRITNEIIKLTSFLTISYITFNTTSEYSSYCITAKCNHLIRVYEQFNWIAEYKHVIRITAEINRYSWHDEALVYKLWQQIINLSFIKTFGESCNKNYDRSIKDSSLSPPGGIHTQGSALASTCHLQQGE